MFDRQLIDKIQGVIEKYWEQLDKILLNSKEDRWLVQFIKYVELTDSCWIWSGSVGHTGTPVWGYKEKSNNPVRIAYNLANGNDPDMPVLEGKVIMHSCDNSLCVNPDHLSLGTNWDNQKDSRDKGRRPKGRPPIKLSYEIAEKIREEYARGGITQLALAKRYDVTLRNMQFLIARDIWDKPDKYYKHKTFPVAYKKLF